MIRTAAIALAVSVALLADPALARPSSEPAALTLTFEVAAETGQVRVALFDNAEAYAGRGAPVAQSVVDVAAGQRQATFPDLKPGTYAAKIFHDIDGDGRMATNPFGMPTEPYAFTNNARGNMGPAGWDRAQVAVTGPTAQTISLR
jgi:uncharacterized protein (DUF2141 family)